MARSPMTGISTGFAIPKPSSPIIAIPEIPLHVKNPARWQYMTLVEYIKDFESKLDSNHEVGARLVSFGQSFTFHIQDLSYATPHIICFHGVDDDGQTVQLVQHVSQLSVLLMAKKKQTDTPRRIGFILEEKAKTDSPEDAPPGESPT